MKSTFLFAILPLLGMSLVCEAQSLSTKPPSPSAGRNNAEWTQELQKKILPLVRTHCVSCHNRDMLPGGVRLSGRESLAEIENHRNTWQRVVMAVQSKQMPPPGATQLTPA